MALTDEYTSMHYFATTRVTVFPKTLKFDAEILSQRDTEIKTDI